MSSVRRLLMCLAVIAVALGGTACGGDPPDQELQQAQTAIDAALAAGAERYSSVDLSGAQDALKNAREAVSQRDYRTALSHALDARARAQTATTQAGDRKTAARADADKALSELTGVVNDGRAKLKTAEASRTSARTLAPARRALGDADKALQKARSAFGKEDYPVAIATAQAALTSYRSTHSPSNRTSAQPVK